MNELGDLITAVFALVFALFGLALFASVVVVGYIFLTSHAVLISEKDSDLKIGIGRVSTVTILQALGSCFAAPLMRPDANALFRSVMIRD